MPADRSLWPVDPANGAPLRPRAQPGYYPGYETLGQQAFWDEATRKVVLARVRELPPVRFFSPSEARLLCDACERLLPQSDRDDEHRIPIVPFIDERLFTNRGDGYRHENMPDDREAYRIGLRGLDEMSRQLHQRVFVELTVGEQEWLLKSLHDGQPAAKVEAWARMPAHRFFMLVLQDAVSVYYAHPWAWDEIGFGGPAYPRGYMRLEGGDPEPWEVDEQRYAWEPPPASISREFTPIAGTVEQHAPPGQGGTH